MPSVARNANHLCLVCIVLSWWCAAAAVVCLTRRYWPLADSTDSIAGKRGRSNKKVDLGAAATYGKEQNVSASACACVACRAIILRTFTPFISRFLWEMKIVQRWRCQLSRFLEFRRWVHILTYFVRFFFCFAGNNHKGSRWFDLRFWWRQRRRWIQSSGGRR